MIINLGIGNANNNNTVDEKTNRKLIRKENSVLNWLE